MKNEKQTASFSSEESSSIPECSHPAAARPLLFDRPLPDSTLFRNSDKDLNIIRLLKKSRREFLMVFDSVPAMIWYRDPNGKILRVNQCAADSVSRSVRELVGRNYYELFPDGAERSRQQDLEVIQSGRPLCGQIREYKGLDGKLHWARVDRIPLRDKQEGRITGVMVFAQDITDQKKAEDHLVRAKKEIELRNQQLEAAAEKARHLAQKANRSNMAKSEMLASSSHDLRTPMNAIIGFSSLLKETRLDSEQAEYVQTINNAATGLLSLINDILDYSKLEAGKLNIQIVPCRIAEFLDEIEHMMSPGAKQKGLAFTIDVAECLPTEFYTDPIRLKQCLINLVGNAVKFTHEGHVDIRVRPQSKGLQRCICFEVRDTGIGIAAEKQAEIFKAYAQADKTTDHTYGGTGLGLSITRKLTELLGGDISVSSQPGNGSIFSIALPLLTSPDPDATRHHLSVEPQRFDDSNAGCRERILVAESNVPSQLTMNLLLRRAGLEVVNVGNRDQLLEKAGSPELGMILLDLAFENGQGLEMIRRLRNDQSRVPIIAIADYDRNLEEAAFAAGCIRYLSRPVSRRELYETIEEVRMLAPLQNGPDGTDALLQQGRIADTMFDPDELSDLLGDLIDELRAAVEQSAGRRAEDVTALLHRISKTGGNPQLTEHLQALDEHFAAGSRDREAIMKIITQIDRLCEGNLFENDAASS